MGSQPSRHPIVGGEAAAPGGTSARSGRVIRSGGDKAHAASAAAWQSVTDNLGAILEASVAAVAGDVIGVCPGFFTSGNSSALFFDAATVPAGSIVNHLGTGGAAGWGNAGWTVGGAEAAPVSGLATYKVVAADLAGGTVTMRMVQRGGSWTLTASADGPARLEVVNFGPMR